MWLIIMLIITTIIVVSQVFLEKIERDDRKKGLKLDHKEYGTFSAFRHMFSSQEKRIKSEQLVPFSSYVKGNIKMKGKLFPMMFAASFVLCGIGVLIAALSGTIPILIPAITAAVIFLEYLSGSIILTAAFLAYLVFSANSFCHVLLIAAEVMMMIIFVSLYRAYKKPDVEDTEVVGEYEEVDEQIIQDPEDVNYPI